MDIPIELFGILIGTSAFMVILGLIRNPQIPATVTFGGMFILITAVMTGNITTNNIETINTDQIGTNQTRSYIYQVDTATTLNTVYDASTTKARTEYVDAGELDGERFQCIEVLLHKTGSPTGNVTFAVMDSNGDFRVILGYLDVNSISSVAEWYEFCQPSGTDIVLQNTDRVGVFYNITSTTIFSYRDGNNPFDGTATVFNTLNLADTWVFTNSADMTMRLYTYIETPLTSETYTYTNYEFTELPKTIIALMGVIFMLLGALMVMVNRN